MNYYNHYERKNREQCPNTIWDKDFQKLNIKEVYDLCEQSQPNNQKY